MSPLTEEETKGKALVVRERAEARVLLELVNRIKLGLLRMPGVGGTLFPFIGKVKKIVVARLHNYSNRVICVICGQEKA